MRIIVRRGVLSLLAVIAGCHSSSGKLPSGGHDLAAGGGGDGFLPRVDMTPPPCSGPGSAPDAWYTYGHDARRTSTSNGCIHGGFKELWRYGGVMTDMGYTPGYYNAVADTTAAYLHASGIGVPLVDRVDVGNGQRVWQYKGSADYDTGNWITVALGYVMVVDDGVYVINGSDGKLKSGGGVDWWGQNTADDQRFYLVTTTHGDGPGAFVGAWDVAKNLVWKANQQGGCMPPVGDENGGLAVDNGVVYFAPRYEVGNSMFGVGDGGTFMVPSGLYAFDAASGTKKWFTGLDPRSAISAANGFVYVVEDGAALVAYKESDGSMAWRAPLSVPRTSVGAQSPLVAGGLVVVATVDHVLAFDATSGAAAWSNPLKGAAAPGFDNVINFVSCPSAGEPAASPVIAKLAAASASATLVATASDGIHTLSLATGAEVDKDTQHTAAYNPIIVGDRLYVLESSPTGVQLVALQSS